WRRIIVDYSLSPLAPEWLKASYRRLRRRQPPGSLPPWIQPVFARRSGLTGLLRARACNDALTSSAQQDIYAEIVADIAPRVAVKLGQWAAHAGLDYRTPFTDARLSRFALAVPPELWFRQGVQKVL